VVESVEQPGAGHGGHGQVPFAGELLERLVLIDAESDLEHPRGRVGRLTIVSAG
jgi:hypothetical protein